MFMKLLGFASPARTPDTTTAAVMARDLSRLKLALACAASLSQHMKPTLCRLPAYCGPGLPRPAISQRSSATVGQPGARRAAHLTRGGAPGGGHGSGCVPGWLSRCAVGRAGTLCWLLGPRHGSRLRDLSLGHAELGLDLLGSRRCEHMHDQGVRLDGEGDSSRQREVTGMYRIPDSHALDADLNARRDVGGLGLY